MEQRHDQKCPFCRKSLPQPGTETELSMKRIEANDPVALWHEGVDQSNKGDYIKAFELYTQAAKLGDAKAHYKLGLMYRVRLGVESDAEKTKYQLEEAAIGGHRRVIEWDNGNIEREVKHFIIAATHGHDKAIKALTEMYKYRAGLVSKEC